MVGRHNPKAQALPEGKDEDMRRTAPLFMAVAAALMLASGIAYAKSIEGDGKDNTLVGKSKNDTISGGGRNDTISGKGVQERLYGDSGSDTVSGVAGPDDVFGGKGADDLFGNGGDDYMNSADNRRGDVVDCGSGFDSAVIDAVNFEPVGAEAGSFKAVGGSDTTVNCEDVTTVLTNPGTGSEDLANLQSSEVDDAVEAGILEEIE